MHQPHIVIPNKIVKPRGSMLLLKEHNDGAIQLYELDHATADQWEALGLHVAVVAGDIRQDNDVRLETVKDADGTKRFYLHPVDNIEVGPDVLVPKRDLFSRYSGMHHY